MSVVFDMRLLLGLCSQAKSRTGLERATSDMEGMPASKEAHGLLHCKALYPLATVSQYHDAVSLHQLLRNWALHLQIICTERTG